MELSELEESRAAQSVPPSDEGGYDEDEQILADVIEGIGLLSTTRTLLEYLASTTLCKGVTKRERDTMDRLSEKIREYLCETEPTYIGGD